MRKLLLVLLLLLPALGHSAFIHTYSFEVTAISGPLTGVSGSGVFSYNDGDLGGTRVLGLEFDDFLFDWAGTIWDESDVLFGSVWLALDGSIDFAKTSSFLGTSCIVGNCGVSASVFEWNLEILGFELNDTFGGEIFRYGTDGGTGIANGTVSIAYLGAVAADAVTSVPEPGTFALLALGLFALARRRLT